MAKNPKEVDYMLMVLFLAALVIVASVFFAQYQEVAPNPSVNQIGNNTIDALHTLQDAAETAQNIEDVGIPVQV